MSGSGFGIGPEANGEKSSGESGCIGKWFDVGGTEVGICTVPLYESGEN